MSTLSRLDVQERAPAKTDPQEVLDILESRRCRAVLGTLGEGSFTASELAEQLDIPRSTLYRYLNRLVDTGLVGESLRLNPNGHHHNEYARRVTDVVVSLSDDDGLSVSLF